MQLIYAMIFWESPNGRDQWAAVEQKNLPEWLLDDDIIARLAAGEMAVNTADKAPRYYKAVQIDRPRPAAQVEARKADLLASKGLSPGGIALH